MDAEAKKYWSERILGRIVGSYKVRRYLFNRSDIPFDKCELCTRMAELLPLGPKDEWVCFDCGMKDPDTRKKKFDRIVEMREAKRNEVVREDKAKIGEKTRTGRVVRKHDNHHKLFHERKEKPKVRE